MDTHQGWVEKDGEGVKCNECNNWIEKGEKAVIMQPAKVNEEYKARPTALAVHGVIHKSCFKEL